MTKYLGKRVVCIIISVVKKVNKISKLYIFL